MKKAKIALWFFGVLFILAGLGSLGASLKGGLLYFLAGVIILPSIKDKFAKILNRDLALKWFVLSSVLLVAIAPIFIQADERKSIENGTASQELIAREARIKEIQEKERVKKMERESKKKETSPEMIEVRANRMAREFVLAHLKDPNSAEFRNQKEFCGEVNAKNSFGGYTGFKRFIATDRNLVVMEGSIPANDFGEVWSKLCG